MVPFTYDYPELSAVALLEAARSLAAAKERDKAIALLRRLLRDHPDSPSAEAARHAWRNWGEQGRLPSDK